MDLVRAHVTIEGEVQGVNFRAATRNKAQAGGVKGWVKNLPDGRVEAIFEGSRSSVQQLVSWCYSGPRLARVNRVEVAWEKPTGQENSFAIVW